MSLNADKAATDTVTLDWGNPAEEAAEFSDRARRVVEKLLAKGCDPEDVEVYNGEQAASIAGERGADADGWFYTGQSMRFGIGKTVMDRACQFKHRINARVCYIIAYMDDTEIGIEVVQIRYGKGGQVRPQAIRVGAPIYSPDFSGVSTDHGDPHARAARKALGCK